VTTTELIRVIVLRLSRFKILIMITGVVLAVVLFLYARTISPVYTSRASVFPLTASSDNSAAATTLSSILGIAETPKSFSQEASINIVELAQSRNVREAVAIDHIPELGKKTIAEILIDNYNKTRPFYEQPLKTPRDSSALAAVGGAILKSGIYARINKNGILEINFSSTNEALVSPVSYKLIDKISEFYKDLKIRKARFDFDFTVRKVDSLEMVLAQYDRRAVRLANTTLFVSPDKIEYQIPKENLVADKDRVLRQRDASANNREEALWRLQKVTPIIAILDKPDPPFEISKPSSLVYALIGFIIGCILGSGLLISGTLYRYAKEEANKAIFGTEHPELPEASKS
jgi:hypothetical protein